MSFQDIELNDQAIIVSQDMLGESFSQEQHPELYFELDPPPLFSQSQQNSHILSELANTPSQPKFQTRRSIIPQLQGLFSYVIENQAKLYDIFQNYVHRLFQLYYYKVNLDKDPIGNYLQVQNIQRKLTYILTIYNQAFTSLKLCIKNYQDKIIIITSDNDKEGTHHIYLDPYSLLTSSEIDLRRAVHEFYSFIDNDDPFISSKGMQGSLNIMSPKNQLKSNPQIEQFPPYELNIATTAEFVLNSLEKEQPFISAEYLILNKVTNNMLSITHQIIQIWLYLFRFFNQYDISNIQFNFEIDPSELNAALVAVDSIIFIPQHLQNLIQRAKYDDIQKYQLNAFVDLPLKSYYDNNNKTTSQKKLQKLVAFDKYENLLKIAEDALTNENENFSFSNNDHSINDEQSDYQATLQKQQRFSFNSHQYRQTIMQQAIELGFDGKLNENHLQTIQPPKHRSYIAEVAQNIYPVSNN